MFLKYILALLFCATVTNIVDAKAPLTDKTESKDVCKPKGKEACTDMDNPCQCYCSVKCGPRDKKPGDAPIYIEDDEYGHHCYCTPRDVQLRSQCPIERPLAGKKSRKMMPTEK